MELRPWTSRAVTTLTADTAAGELALDVSRGEDSGVRYLLLHGLSQQRAFWGPVAARLPDAPIALLDQRGHGDSSTALTESFSVNDCAADVPLVLDALGWQDAVVVGHSWGAWVGTAAAAMYPDRVSAVVQVDGGLARLADLGAREEIRQRLAPPRLEINPDDFDSMMARWNPSIAYTAETSAALRPGWHTNDAGMLVSRLGFDRHMAVLDGLLDHDPHLLWPRLTMPIWTITCSTATSADDDWANARDKGLALLRESVANLRVLDWFGAVHDVPLQWPALVAGAIVSAGQEVAR